MLALLPSAHGETYATLIDEIIADDPGDVAPLEPALEQALPCVISVYGPLEHHWSWFASYDMLVCQVAEACSTEAPFIVLDIDSPGGLVSGCFDASRRIREMCRKAGKKLVAYVNGMACSAAYSLACAADEIVVGQTSMVGSVGVIDCMVDVTGNDAQHGIKFAVITSGERKADGNPHTPLDAKAIAISQQRVDELAQIFFAWVSETRGISVAEVQALQAGISYGEKAVALRLADSVSTLDQLIARLSSPQVEEQSEMKMSYKDAKKALESVAADSAASDDDKASAKKMLAALEEDDDKAEESDDKKKDDDKEESKASESDDDEDDKKKKKDEKKDDDKATASALARVEARLDAAERAGKVKALLAARPDLTSAQVSAFKKIEPGALVSILLATPVNKTEGAALKSPMASALAGVKGEAAPTEAAPPKAYDEKRAKQRAKMGLGQAPKAAIRQEGSTTYYDLAVKPEEV
jgi:signal peptide peptidase SppA